MQPYAPQGPSYPHAPNPYAAPGPALYRQNVFVPPGEKSGELPSPWLRNTKLALGIVQLSSLLFGIAAFVAAGVVDSGDDDGGALVVAGALLLGVWYLALIAYGLVNLIWVYKFWSWIPTEQRHTKMWKKYISPGTATVLMVVPYFNIYWMFVVYLGICEIFERLAVAYPTDKPSPKNLAIATLVVPLVFFPAGPFLHYLFDKHVEAMAKETAARMAAAPQAGLAPAYVPPGYPGQVGGQVGWG
jgi:hypothetical protein